MTGRMPPIPPANRSNKGVPQNADAARDTSHKKDHTENTEEQGETANIKQNTTNAGFFKGRRVKYRFTVSIGRLLHHVSRSKGTNQPQFACHALPNI